jgi:tetratricopeptide (TPR) repeat protein
MAERQGRHATAAAQQAVAGLLAAGRTVEAASRLPTWKPNVESAAYSVLGARIALAEGNREIAGVLAGEALKECSRKTARSTLQRLTRLLLDLGRKDDALTALEKLALPEVPDESAYAYLDCARQMGRHGTVLDFCRASRKHGVFDEVLIARELDVLEKYDPEAAVALLLELVARRPEDKRAHLHLVSLAIRLGKHDLATAHVDRLPSVEEAEPDVGEAVVSALRFLGRHAEALHFAYNLLRRHFADHRAHRAFRDATLFDGEDVPSPAAPGGVAAGMAVGIVEDGTNAIRWYVLEDSAVAAVGVDFELRADSPLARLMIGKQIGERFAFSGAGALARHAVVREVVPKEVFRFRDVCDQWQLRFPDQQEMWMIRTPTSPDGEPDVSSIVALMQERVQETRRIHGLYVEKHLPIHVVGRALNIDDVQAMDQLARADGVPLRCCEGSAEEYADAVAAVRLATEVVVDISALTTLLLLDDLDLLTKLGRTIVVTHPTLSTLRALVEGPTGRGKSRRVTPRAAGDPVTAEMATPSGPAELLSRLESAAQVVGCPELAYLGQEERRRLLETLGPSAAHSMLVARGGDRVLWTDDPWAAFIGRKQFGTKRVWTQGLLRALLEEGRIDEQCYNVASARLLGYEYTFTSVTPDIIAQAGALAEWHVDQWPFRRAVAYLELDSVRVEDAARLAAFVIARAWRELGDVNTCDAILRAVLDRIAGRRDGRPVLRSFKRLLYQAFGLNVIGAAQAAKASDSWVASRERGVVIVPGR